MPIAYLRSTYASEPTSWRSLLFHQLLENRSDPEFIIVMHQIIAKRPVGRPKGSTMGIIERIERYRLAEKCVRRVIG
jgi:hypothetical protein